MKLFFKAGKSANAGLLLIRLALGSLFLFAGAKKILDLHSFIESVQAMGKMDDNVAFILAFALPFMELMFGALYIIGLFTPITSFAIAMMSLSFILMQGPWHEELPFNFNFVFLACALATMISGAGRISFDALVDKPRDEKVPATPPTHVINPPANIQSVEEQIELKQKNNDQ
jgi:uncharacterized membrane protein YphA (DoxX/SURF4 family)